MCELKGRSTLCPFSAAFEAAPAACSGSPDSFPQRLERRCIWSGWSTAAPGFFLSFSLAASNEKKITLTTEIPHGNPRRPHWITDSADPCGGKRDAPGCTRCWVGTYRLSFGCAPLLVRSYIWEAKVTKRALLASDVSVLSFCYFCTNR